MQDTFNFVGAALYEDAVPDIQIRQRQRTNGDPLGYAIWKWNISIDFHVASCCKLVSV
jgi:hypothetical protein